MIVRLPALLVSLCFCLGVLLPGPALAAGSASGSATTTVQTQLPQEVPALGETGSAPVLGEPVPGVAPQLDEPGSAAVLSGVDPGTVAVLSEPSQAVPGGAASTARTQQDLPGRPVVPLVVLGGALVLAGVLLAAARRDRRRAPVAHPGAAARPAPQPS